MKIVSGRNVKLRNVSESNQNRGMCILNHTINILSKKIGSQQCKPMGRDYQSDALAGLDELRDTCEPEKPDDTERPREAHPAERPQEAYVCSNFFFLTFC